MTTVINGALPPPKQIRFVNNQGQPPSKRRRINAAYVCFPISVFVSFFGNHNPWFCSVVAFRFVGQRGSRIILRLRRDWL